MDLRCRWFTYSPALYICTSYKNRLLLIAHMKSHLLIVVNCFFILAAYSQKYTEPDKLKTFNIVVNYDSYTVKTQMLKDNRQIDVKDDRTYMWCSANKIIETKAGYDGKLLHGYYKSFYFENNQLRESGTVRYGLKNKEWRYWYSDGKLREVITYKNGKKNGKYVLYNDYGNMMAKGRFKNDLLHGAFYTYTNFGAVEAKKKYRSGNEVIPKTKPAKVKKETAPKTEKKQKAEKAPADAGTGKAAPAKQKKKKEPAEPGTKKSSGKKLKGLFKKKDKPASQPGKQPASSSA